MKILSRVIKYFFLIVIIIVILPYLFCPFYKHPETKQFAGTLFYNPYEKIDSTAWRKANFHSHTRQWMGITAGSRNIADEVARKYGELNYDIIGISDYESINRRFEPGQMFIPIYEHGYNLLKCHQLVIGAETVSWYDFLLVQSFSNLQDVICSLKKNNEVISINHPKLRNAYSPEDLKYLREYDLLEVANHSYFNALDLWDTVLSNGNTVFAIGNDDNHDINDPEDYGYVFNMINSSQLTKQDITDALRNGRSFVVELEPQKDSSPQRKLQQSKSIPLLTSCTVTGNKLQMCFDKSFDTLKLIGQDGITKKTEIENDTVNYAVGDNDTYIRAEIRQHDNSNVYLNPVLRFNGELSRTSAVIDYEKTWIYRGVYLVILAAICVIYFNYRK